MRDASCGCFPGLARIGGGAGRRISWSLILVLALFAGAPLPIDAQELTLSVAISMKDAMRDLGRLFERTRPGVFLRFNFASSGELQKQIEAGAPVDVFVSAADQQIDELERKGLILPGSRRTFARNALSVIVPADSRLAITRPAGLTQPHVRRLAIGNPKTVPAGRYAEESLRMLDLWDALRSKCVFGENVRQVLEYVARDEVDAGFVYATDPATRKDLVKEAFRPPQSSYTPIVYPAVIVAGSQQADLGRAFIELLVSRQGQDALARRGFLPPTESR